MKTRRYPVSLHALAVLVAALSPVLAACGSGTGPESDTTTTVEPTTEAEGTSTTVDGPTTTSSMATTTTEATTTASEADVIEIVVEDAEVVSGPDEIAVELGSTVMFVVVSDAADHVHVHGYDLFSDVAPGSPAEIEFTADVPGIFEIELEDSHMLLVELEVR